jgi:MFS superfamily sulfate permease-like transporter
MAADRWRGVHLKNALAFVFTIIVGIAAGCVWAVAEAIEDQRKPPTRHSTGHTQDRR